MKPILAEDKNRIYLQAWKSINPSNLTNIG
jgi:hypothetical protein